MDFLIIFAGFYIASQTIGGLLRSGGILGGLSAAKAEKRAVEAQAAYRREQARGEQHD